MKITKSTAEEVMKHHFGKAPKEVREVPGGLVNFVYMATVDAARYIIRISDDQARMQYFQKEQWAVKKAQELKVPVPEILEVGNEASSFPYMIVRWVEGTPALDIADRREIIRQMGKYTALIHTIPTSGYGHIFDWSSNQLSRKETWKEYLEKEFGIEERLATLERHKMLDEEGMISLRRQAKEIMAWDGKPHLSHCDMRLKNVLVDDKGKIAAILDWESCMSQIVPYWELAVALDDFAVDDKEAFLDGYGMTPQEYRRIAPGVKALNMLNFAQYVEGAYGEKNEVKRKEITEAMRARLRGAYDLYSLD